jgi:uncharacterized delta-60 repeat protein
MPPKSSRPLTLTALVSLLALFITAAAAAAGSPGTISFTSATYEVDEGAGSAAVKLTRTGGADGAVAAKVSLADVTTAAADYQLRPGSLDLSYAFVPVTFFYYYQGMALQPDGKLVIGGSGSPLLKRLNTDGTLDSSFTPPAFNAPIEAVALQPDGKIIVSGTFTGIPGAIRIARLNPDGSLDTSFNVGGGPNDDPIAIVVQPDGKIVIGGYFTSVNLSAHRHIARLNADGSVDETFNAGAFQCYALALQPDGKILAGSPFLLRFNADGTPDESFPSLSYFAFAIAPQPDGKILFGGTLRDNAGNDISRGVYRLLSDGSLDPSFTTGTGTDGGIDALAVQPDGKIIAGGGMSSYNGTPAGCLIRLNPDGSLDSSLKLDQFVDPSISQIVMQPDGKVIANGRFTATTPAGSRTNVARFNGDLFVNWAAGDAADKTVSIPIANDLLDEPDETATLTLTPLSGAAAGAIPTSTLTIVDNDVPPSFTSPTPPQAIKGVPYTHTFTASGSPAPTFTVTSGTLPSGMLLQPTGLLSGTPFSTGTFSLTVTASNGVAPAATQTFDLVVASGGAFQFAAPSYSVNENGGSVTITVNRVGGSAGSASVNYNATGNIATPGSDFTLTPGTLTFAEGETSKTFDITINDDAVNELNETVNVFINNATGTAALGSPAFVTLTILNDDPLPTISIEDTTVTEGDSGTKTALFTVTRTGLTDRGITFSARTADGTAHAQEDYLSINSNFIFLSPTSASVTVPVQIIGDTITETDKAFVVNISSAANATIARSAAVGVIKDNETAAGVPTVQFGAQVFSVSEGAGIVDVSVTRSGDSSAPTSVFYSTVTSFPSSGLASERRDYNIAFGTLRFAAGETSKTFQVFITDDAFVEGDETLQVIIGTPTGGVTRGTPSVSTVRIVDNDTAAGPNPIDDSTFFVRQHYRDFLNRDPDAPGLAFWVNEIESCGTNTQCREVKRINVSAAFFLSIEFKETGYLDYRLHKAAFNTGERLDYTTFLGDTQELARGVVVGATGWEAALEANKQAFIDLFVQRPEFVVAYPQTLTPAQFVDTLNANTGDPLNPSSGGSLTQGERDQLVADLTSGAKTRAQVLRAVAENAEFQRRQSSKAFVLMQYFGYLRRAPNDSPNTNFDGYNFWLSKLNEFHGNFIQAEMVKAFITAPEYRQRFGQ